MSNPLNISITASNLLRFCAPSIFTMMFISFYIMVDGVFVARFVNTDALSALNIVYPTLTTLIAIALMLAQGGGAMVAATMGRNENQKARQLFSLLVYTGITIGCTIAFLCLLFRGELVILLGSNEQIYDYCLEYALPLFIFMPCCFVQILFQHYFVTAGKPSLGLMIIFVGGVSNIAFDYIFIVIFNLGLFGAALATGIGFLIPTVFSLAYFSFNKNQILYFCKPSYDFKAIFQAMVNGSSAMVNSFAGALITYLYNITMMKFVGPDGVAAITIILYAQFLFLSAFIGYGNGVGSLFSYNFGNENYDNIRKLFNLSAIKITILSISIFIWAYFYSESLILFFAKDNLKVVEIANIGMKIFAFSFLVEGFNIFCSAYFVALLNGKIAFAISFARTFIFYCGFILLLPNLLGITGLWLAAPVAEFLTIALCLFFLKTKTARI